jgi:hypothetical protein
MGDRKAAWTGGKLGVQRATWTPIFSPPPCFPKKQWPSAACPHTGEAGKNAKTGFIRCFADCSYIVKLGAKDIISIDIVKIMPFLKS